MKQFQNILGCSLVAGLMTVTTSQVHAGGTVIGGELYTPLTISVSATFDINGKNKKENISEKDIIEALDLPSTTDLVWNLSTGHVWSMNSKTKTLGDDLSEEGFFSITSIPGGSTAKGDKTTYTGTVGVEIYSDPVLNMDGSVNSMESADVSSNWIQINGLFKGTETNGAVKNGFIKITTTYSAKGLTGNVFVGELSNIPVAGSGSIGTSGSGSVQVM